MRGFRENMQQMESMSSGNSQRETSALIANYKATNVIIFWFTSTLPERYFKPKLSEKSIFRRIAVRKEFGNL